MAKGYVGLAALITEKKIDDQEDMIGLTIANLIANLLIEEYGFENIRLERNPSGEINIEGDFWYKILGAGGRFRMRGILSVEQDGSWEYLHQRALDDKAEPFASVLRAGSSIVMSSEGFKVRPPAVKAAADKGPKTRADTDNSRWVLGRDRVEVTVNQVSMVGLDKSENWRDFFDYVKKRPVETSLHGLNVGKLYISVEENRGYLFRFAASEAADVEFVWIVRDNDGFWVIDHDDKTWTRLWLGENVNFSGKVSNTKWSLSIVRPTINTSIDNGSQVDYALSVTKD